MARSKEWLDPDQERHFPNLRRDLYEVKSDPTPLPGSVSVPAYNCIAFAAGDEEKWWWPDSTRVYFWPSNVPREETVEGFVEMFESLGYEQCGGAEIFEIIFERVAIYRTNLGNPWTPRGFPTHAARQSWKRVWLSKLGEWQDIEHATLDCLCGEDVTGRTEPYGEVVAILKRKRKFLGLVLACLGRTLREFRA